jgi:hypothetical protein
MTDHEIASKSGSESAWYRRPGLLTVLALVVLAVAIGVGLLLAADDADDSDTVATGGTTVDTAPTTEPALTAAPTTAPAPTTASTAPDEAACVAGDQVACDRLPDDLLDTLCDGGNGSLDACQVLLAHQGDGVPDGPEGEGQGNGNGNNGNGNGNDGNGNGNGNDDDGD